jgi:hypothetical protein
MTRAVPLLVVLLAGCATTAATPTAQDEFFTRVSALCGQSLSGRLVSNDPQDREMAGKPMIASVGPCTPSEVPINFAVGTDKSRNWVVSRVPGGLTLTHIHLHEDGTEDALSRYGGRTIAPGSASRQEFPADDFSKALFVRHNIPQSTTNVWSMDVRPSFLAYELRRPGRSFRVEMIGTDRS